MTSHKRFNPRFHTESKAVDGRPALLTLISGKGGSGRTVIAHNLAIAAGRRGIRTLLVDMDWHLGDLHIVSNAAVKYTLGDVISRAVLIEEALVKVGPNTQLLASPAVNGVTAPPTIAELRDIFECFRDPLRRYDLIIVDTASGLNELLSALVELSDETALTLNPELSSISAGYGLYKWLCSMNPGYVGSFLINRVEHAEDARDIAEKFETLTYRFLGKKPRALGYLQSDPGLARAVSHQRSVFEERPLAATAAQFSTLIGQLGQRLFKNRTAAQLITNSRKSINLVDSFADSRE